jgi:energy-coupling factor transporter ATP-binding protein EcfA2
MRSSDSSTPAENAAVELEAVSMIYGSNGSKVAALDALSLVFARGTFTAVMGPSGSGKTTLLQSASGLVRPTKGAVLARRRTGESVCARARRRGTSLVRRRGCADAVRPPPARRGHELTLHFDNGHFALAADHDVRDPARASPARARARSRSR